MLVGERREAGRENTAAEAFRDAQPDRSREHARVVADHFLDTERGRLHCLGMLEQSGAAFGQRVAGDGLFEQGRLESSLEPLQASRNRRRVLPQHFGRGSKPVRAR